MTAAIRGLANRGAGSGPVTVHGPPGADDFAGGGTGCAFTTDGRYPGISPGARVVAAAPDGTVPGSGAPASPQAVTDAGWPLVTPGQHYQTAHNQVAGREGRLAMTSIRKTARLCKIG
jgi:hypothetical protein